MAGIVGMVCRDQTITNGMLKGVGLNTANKYVVGGRLFAGGLSNFGVRHSPESLASVTPSLESSEAIIQHGAIFNLGMRFALSNNA